LSQDLGSQRSAAAIRRTIERLGARLVEIVPLPEDNDQYRDGDREKCCYRLDI